jgi:hypothetical protein
MTCVGSQQHRKKKLLYVPKVTTFKISMESAHSAFCIALKTNISIYINLMVFITKLNCMVQNESVNCKCSFQKGNAQHFFIFGKGGFCISCTTMLAQPSLFSPCSKRYLVTSLSSIKKM